MVTPYRISPSTLPRTSSNFDPNASRTGLTNCIPGDKWHPDPLNREDWYNPLDRRVNAPFEQAQQVSSVVYNGDPLPTLAFNSSQSTTYWWMIVQYNGYCHPDDIPKGAHLDIPDMKTILAASRKGARLARVVETL